MDLFRGMIAHAYQSILLYLRRYGWTVLCCSTLLLILLLSACGTTTLPAVTPSKESPDDIVVPTPTTSPWPDLHHRRP